MIGHSDRNNREGSIAVNRLPGLGSPVHATVKLAQPSDGGNVSLRAAMDVRWRWTASCLPVGLIGGGPPR
jgi:hypothetical protein